MYRGIIALGSLDQFLEALLERRSYRQQGLAEGNQRLASDRGQHGMAHTIGGI